MHTEDVWDNIEKFQVAPEQVDAWDRERRAKDEVEWFARMRAERAAGNHVWTKPTRTQDNWIPRLTREAVMRRAKRRCERCHSPTAPVQLHHVTYEFFNNELPEDLEALCADCHHEQHYVGGVYFKHMDEKAAYLRRMGGPNE